MSNLASIPGLYYTFVRPARMPSPLRTDVAGFYGRTMRGPVGTAVRVEGWREYVSLFGNITANAMTPYAVQGYFNNDAQTAYAVRLLGPGSTTASATWNAGTFDAATGRLNADWPGGSGLTALQFQVKATSAGDWSNQTSVRIRYWLMGSKGKPELEIETIPPNEPAEILSGIDPNGVVHELNAQSAYIQLTASVLPGGLAVTALASPPAPQGPRYYEWPVITLEGGTSLPPTVTEYMNAIQVLGDQPEVALVASPDLYHPDFSDEDLQRNVIIAMLAQASQQHDRLVVLDVPPSQADPVLAVQWVQQLRKLLPEPVLQNGAVYHPRVQVADPLGGAANPLRCIPCSGPVTGVISRLDVPLGAYFTPANAPIQQASDLSLLMNANEQAMIYNGGINLLTCSPNQGLLVWGGRVLGQSSPGGFVAHRRLIHLLVRAIRSVAQPLVFDINGPALWLAFVRAITTILLEAYRAGALQGDQPNQAFQVTCDATTNPPDQIDNGTVVCLIKVAPAIPMEFITLRVAVSAQGQLEVFES